MRGRKEFGSFFSINSAFFESALRREKDRQRLFSSTSIVTGDIKREVETAATSIQRDRKQETSGSRIIQEMRERTDSYFFFKVPRNIRDEGEKRRR